MSVESFLNSPCRAWMDPDEAGADAWEGKSLLDAPTWRDWLKDVLVSLAVAKEGFDGKRPNCEAGWGTALANALHENGVTMAEVVARVFDAGRHEAYRLHEPGPRTARALEGFRDWSKAEGNVQEAARLAGQALGHGRGSARFDRQTLRRVRAALEEFSFEKGPDSPVSPDWPPLVRRYLDEVDVDAWKRTDAFLNKSR